MTLTELKQRVLEKLGVLATGEAPVIGDATIVGDRYVSLHDMLITDGLVNWTNTEDIPSWAEEPISMLVAAFSLNEFGVPQSRRQQIRMDGAYKLPSNQGGPSLAERQLREQAAKNFVYYPQPAEYF